MCCVDELKPNYAIVYVVIRMQVGCCWRLPNQGGEDLQSVVVHKHYKPRAGVRFLAQQLLFYLLRIFEISSLLKQVRRLSANSPCLSKKYGYLTLRCISTVNLQISAAPITVLSAAIHHFGGCCCCRCVPSALIGARNADQ